MKVFLFHADYVTPFDFIILQVILFEAFGSVRFSFPGDFGTQDEFLNFEIKNYIIECYTLKIQ